MSSDFNYQTTTQDISLWVDAAQGSDWNSGVQESPLKTLVAAIRNIPLVVRHNVTVNVRAGTYKEKLDLLFFFAGGGDIKFVGVDWNKFLPATGIQSGTFDIDFGAPTIPNTASCADGGWTVDNLKSKFVVITSGIDNGKYFPIANNTATTIDFGMPVDRIAGRGKDFRGQTFSIVEHAVILEQQIMTSLSPYLISVCGTSPPSQSRSISGSILAQNGILFQNFQFNMGSAYEALGCNSGGALRLQSCTLNYSPNTIYGFFGARGSSATFLATDCYWAMLSGNNYGFGGGSGARIRLYNCIMENGGYVGAAEGSNINLSGLYQNQGSGINIRDSTATFAGNIVLRSQKNAVYLRGKSLVTIDPIDGCGFLMNVLGSGITFTGFSNSVQLKNLIIENCATGVQIEGTHNYIDLPNCVIRNSTAWGINMAASRHVLIL